MSANLVSLSFLRCVASYVPGLGLALAPSLAWVPCLFSLELIYCWIFAFSLWFTTQSKLLILSSPWVSFHVTIYLFSWLVIFTSTPLLFVVSSLSGCYDVTCSRLYTYASSKLLYFLPWDVSLNDHSWLNQDWTFDSKAANLTVLKLSPKS